MARPTVVDVIRLETGSSQRSKWAGSDGAIDIVKLRVSSALNVLDHSGKLDDFSAYMAVTNLVAEHSGYFSSDLHDVVDHIYQLAWLGDLLRKCREPFITAYSPRFNSK